MLNLNLVENLKPKGTGYMGGCPVCIAQGSDKSRNHLSILENGKYNCVVDSNHNKEIFKLIGLKENPAFDTFFEERPVVIRKQKIYDESCLLRLLPVYDYWINRRISQEVLRKFSGGLAFSGPLKNYFVFPIYNENKQIVGFDGRYTGKYDKPKWMKTGYKSEWIFPIYLNKDIILQKKEVILTESLGDLLSLFESGIENVLCCFGKNISTKLLNRLVSLNLNRIILAFNNDGAGLDACKKSTEKLKHFFNVEKIFCHLPPVKDLNELLLQSGTQGITEWYRKLIYQPV